MEEYVHRKNLERFYDLLFQATDDARREQIKKLIKDEQAKLPQKSTSLNSWESETASVGGPLSIK